MALGYSEFIKLCTKVSFNRFPVNFIRFILVRTKDVSGISGTGIVASGCEFSNKKCVIYWESTTPSLEIHESIEDIIKIHGHSGATQVVWLDKDENKTAIIADV